MKRSGFSLVLVIAVLISLLGVFTFAQASYNLPPGPVSIIHQAWDYQVQPGDSIIYQYVGERTIWSGNSIQPMAYLSAELTYESGCWYGYCSAPTQTPGLDFYTWFVVQPTGNLPADFTGQIPYKINLALDATAHGAATVTSVSALAAGQGWTNLSGQHISKNMTISGLANPGQWIPVSMSAALRLDADQQNPNSGGQIVIDPYLYIDPSWQYANYFKVYITYDGSELGPEYKAIVPVPAAVWLLGSGLIGLIGIRRFRK
jgi:hypothetical protein